MKNKYTAEKYPAIRKATVELLRASRRKNMIHSFIEVDISAARKALKTLKKESGQFISFTGYIIYCAGKAVEKDKHVHAYRDRRNHLIMFDDVDVSTTIERKVDGKNEVVAMIVRAANKKSIASISEEIRQEKNKHIDSAEVYRSIKLYLSVPAFIRRLVFRLLDRSPGQMKKRAGTVMVTSGNMVGRGAGWGLPIASHTLNITIGSIVDRLVNIEGSPEAREHLCLTISFDHDIVDGAPAARFTRQLKKIIESGILNDKVTRNNT
ncbi:MAG: 2-oxo acid dehydrogenase subunit E2 [Bacteroidales bacterium]|nr:2-oxo acid dehydrogenase subunit E2 [Bacteroidales bacterium]